MGFDLLSPARMSDPEILSPMAAKRHRSTKAQVEARRQELLAIVAEQKPMSVRQVFYQATVRGLIPKTETGYGTVKDELAFLRRNGRLPYRWITDATRWQRKPQTYSSIAHALAETAQFYRRSLWRDSDAYVEIWIEKDALTGVVLPITDEFDVPLMVARGYPSLSFLHSAAEHMAAEDRPCYVYHFGDHDPSGVDAARAIEKDLREMAPGAEIRFERKAVLPWQIDAWSLPSRPTKKTDSRSKKWKGGDSVELDAINPQTLRGLVRTCIEEHVDREKLNVLLVAERSERDQLAMFAHEARGS